MGADGVQLILGAAVPVTAALIAAIRYLLARLLPPAAKPWAEVAAYFALGALAVRAWGLWHSVSWDVAVSCELAHAAGYGLEQFLPLEGECAPAYDLVPGYVNRLIVVFLVAAVSCAGTAVALRCHEHRAVRIRR